MRKAALLLALLALPVLAAVQTGTTTRSAELRSTPFSDGKTLQTLPQGTTVEVVKRMGGWYEVKAGASQGWVRMWLLRFSTQASGGANARETAQVIRSGRASSTYTTATTGVRGLSEEELANATPNPAAVQSLEQLAVAPNDAQAFAKKASLFADPRALR